MPGKNDFKTVAVIMRTKDRLLFIKRALESVAKQTYHSYDLVIINDGGEAQALNTLIDRYRPKLKGAVTVLHNKSSAGKWRAANQGIEASNSSYIVLHDDDDTWEPDFLQETVTFLEDGKNRRYGGVASSSHLVKETVRAEAVHVISSARYAQEIKHASIYELCRHNIFPPIAYLYRRSVHDKVGSYNEHMFALADWEFNLRTIEKFDIAMLPKHLANWHQRAAGSNDNRRPTFANVTAPDSWEYQENIVGLLNSLLRKDLESGKLGIGYLVNLFYNSQDKDSRKRAHLDYRLDDLHRLLMDKLQSLHADINHAGQPASVRFYRKVKSAAQRRK